ncbi:MAG: enterochelin esterase [Clostridia bacterium]|nr:enterochelin esterase [Clostridia bacterium]
MNKPFALDTALSFDPYPGEPSRDGVQGCEVTSEGRVRFRIIAPEAKQVWINQFFDNDFYLDRAADGAWEGEFDMGRGFLYFFLKIDGADVLSPYMPIGYGCCRPMNFVFVPVSDMEGWDDLEGIEHGGVTRRYYFSSVTGKTEICLIYTPPFFDASQSFPVLYLQHGYGENETGWTYQGHVNRIADRLLHEGRMKPMLIVMGNGMAQKDGKAQNTLYPEILVKDLIPFIEDNYPVKKDKWSRAMAGLSMGSYQTSIATMSHPELFGYAGIFSGFMRAPWKPEWEKHMDILNDRETFNASYKVFYRAMGTEDTYFARFAEDDALLEGRGLNILRETFPGGHDWTVWRRCIYSFLPKLF